MILNENELSIRRINTLQMDRLWWKVQLVVASHWGHTDVFCNECSAILCTMTIVSVVNAWIIAVHWLCHYVACRVVSHSRRRLANFDKLTSVASYEVMVIFCVEQYTYRGPKTPLQTCAILADWLNRSMQDCDEGAMIFRLYICFAGCRSNHIISEQLHRTSNWSFSSARMRLYCARLVVVLSVRWTNHYLAAHPARWSVCCGRPLYLARKVLLGIDQIIKTSTVAAGNSVSSWSHT